MNRIVIPFALLALCLSASAQTSQLRSSSLPPEARSAISKTITQLGRLSSSNGETDDQFGYAIAISGNTVVVGAPGASGGTEAGIVYVFQKPSTGWSNMTQTAELTATNAFAGTQFGYSVAIAGTTIIVGAPDSNLGPGAAYTFVEPAGGWTNMTQTAELLASDGQDHDGFGTSVAISGSTLVVGSPYATIGSNSEQGAAYVFTESAGVWKQSVKITASDGDQYDTFGSAVAITTGLIVSGSPQATIGSNGNQGAAYVFAGSAANWKQKAKLTASNGISGSHLGHAVAVSGETVVAGTYIFPFPQRQGAAYVFVEPVAGWSNMTQTAELTANDPSSGDQLGWSVATNGNLVIVGAPESKVGSNADQGIAYVFTKPTTGWASTNTFTAKLTASGGTKNAQFGSSVAMTGSNYVVGAQTQNVGENSDEGEAYIFN